MQIHSVGIDPGKATFHLVALGAAGKVLVRKKFSQQQLLEPKTSGPFLEGQVAGHQRRCAFATLTEGLEQQLGADLGQKLLLRPPHAATAPRCGLFLLRHSHSTRRPCLNRARSNLHCAQFCA